MGLQVTRGDIENVLIHAGILLMIALGILFGRPLLGPTEEAVPVALPAVTPQPGSAPGLATPTAPPPVIDAGQGPGLGGRPLDASGPAAAVPAQESPRSPADSQPAGDPDRPRAVFKYTVEPGDMVSEIADRFGISAETVMSANDLLNPDALTVAEELVILPASGVLHAVSNGDTLNDLARAYDVSVESIMEYNGIPDPTILQVGEKLLMPGGKILMARAGATSRGERPAAAASGSFRWPAAGNISTYFSSGHRGIDLAAQQGNPVYAADGGVVVTALKDYHDYGWHLVIDHGNGFQTLYGHLSAFYVDYGERVSKGERIGAIGSTGLSTGPHLHFEVFQNGAHMDPLRFLP